MPIIKNEIIIDPSQLAETLRTERVDTAIYILSVLKEKMNNDYQYQQLEREVCNRYDIGPSPSDSSPGFR